MVTTGDHSPIKKEKNYQCKKKQGDGSGIDMNLCQEKWSFDRKQTNGDLRHV
jgi:hypothetical protein